MTTLGSLRLVIPSALALLATYATASGQCMYWDGVGMSTGRTLDMTVFDVGFGPELFATHNSAVFRWTGTSWAGIPDDFDDDPEALCGYDDGTGPTLYVAGRFTAQYWTGAPMWHIAKMSFGGWVAFGGGLPTPDPTPYINRMLVFDDGTGAQLYVAGGFTTYPNINSNNIVRWNGTAWSG